jgi:hypothetical protein
MQQASVRPTRHLLIVPPRANRDAAAGPVCPQMFIFELEVGYSEDCLTVDIWAPVAAPPPGLRRRLNSCKAQLTLLGGAAGTGYPILLFFPGGAWEFQPDFVYTGYFSVAATQNVRCVNC